MARTIAAAVGVVLARIVVYLLDWPVPQRDMTTAGPWAGGHAPCPEHRLPRHGVHAHALQQEPGDPQGHRGHPKEHALTAGRFDDG